MTGNTFFKLRSVKQSKLRLKLGLSLFSFLLLNKTVSINIAIPSDRRSEVKYYCPFEGYQTV